MTTLTTPTPCQADPDLFFDAERLAEAKAICSTCPLMLPCRETGREHTYGVWGGTASGGTAREAVKVHGEWAMHLIAAGESFRDVALTTGLTVQQLHRLAGPVSGQANSVRNPARPIVVTNEIRDRALDLYFNEKLAQAVIARTLGVHRKVIGRIVEKAITAAA